VLAAERSRIPIKKSVVFVVSLYKNCKRCGREILEKGEALCQKCYFIVEELERMRMKNGCLNSST
jgi:ribosomal protein L37E